MSSFAYLNSFRCRLLALAKKWLNSRWAALTAVVFVLVIGAAMQTILRGSDGVLAKGLTNVQFSSAALAESLPHKIRKKYDCDSARKLGLRLPVRCRSKFKSNRTNNKSSMPKRYKPAQSENPRLYRKTSRKPTRKTNRILKRKRKIGRIISNSPKNSDRPSAKSDSKSNDVVASRIFARRGEYPPEQFKAYGILAFPALATKDSRARHLMICEAYRNSLPPSVDIAAPASQQMVTVWPIKEVDDDTWRGINSGTNACASAVHNYGLILAKIALKHARIAGRELRGRGPYLLAWAPPTEKGKQQAIVLYVDLTNVTRADHANDIFRRWARDIEAEPSLWENGWDTERVRSAMRQWVDRYGQQLMSLIVN